MQGPTITFPILGDWFVCNMPRFFTVFGFAIHFYALFLALGLVAGAIYALARAKRFGLTQDNVLDYLLFAVPSAIIFSRLYYVVFHLDVYLRNPIRIITGIREGGLTIYGVIFGAVLGVWLCSRIRKLPFRDFLDLGAHGLLIGQAIGRWGNFVNRELYGGETTLPWRMGLTVGEHTKYVHPTFLYESIWNTIGVLLLHFCFPPERRRYSGQIFIAYLIWYGLGRMWIEPIRANEWNMMLGGFVSLNFLIALACVVGGVVANVILTKRATGKGA